MSVGSAPGNLGVILELRMQEFLRITASHVIEVNFGIPLGDLFTEFLTFLGSRNKESKVSHPLSHLSSFVCLKTWNLPYQKIVLHPIFTASGKILALLWLK